MKAEYHHKKQLTDKYNECMQRLIRDLVMKREALLETVDSWDFKEYYLKDRTFFTETAEMAFIKGMRDFKDEIEAEYEIMRQANSIIDNPPDEEE
jgi:hypothetical protein